VTVPHRVLVVEDDETIRESLIEFLEDNGYQATGAGHGREALEKLQGTEPRPCLIVLDLMMPVMDGASFREQQLQDPALSQIPVVVVSAYREVSRRAAELSAAAHLQKPLKLAELLEVVERHC
jgi:CheY-like chemotaxis protein